MLSIERRIHLETTKIGLAQDDRTLTGAVRNYLRCHHGVKNRLGLLIYNP
jgi:hypothetical protein